MYDKVHKILTIEYENKKFFFAKFGDLEFLVLNDRLLGTELFHKSSHSY